MKITDAHLSPLAEAEVRRFEDEMIVHLRSVFPDILARQDDTWVRELIQEGIEQAGQYDIVLERDVGRYVDLMLALSPDFADDPNRPWCSSILTSESLTAQEKLDRIYEHIIFAREGGRAVQDSIEHVPRPFNRAAMQEADDRLRTEHPEVVGRRITMAVEDDTYRGTWTSAYHESLERVGASPITSRPHIEVGAPAVRRPESITGDLTIALVDAENGHPIVGASAQVSGPAVERTVSDHAGEARFVKIATGEYDILALDPQRRMGQGHAVVKRGTTRVELSCRRMDHT